MTEAPQPEANEGDAGAPARRGRPRPQATVDRDQQVLELLKKGPLTKDEVAEKLGIGASAAYLSLFRLNHAGAVKKSPSERNGGESSHAKSWEVVVGT